MIYPEEIRDYVAEAIEGTRRGVSAREVLASVMARVNARFDSEVGDDEAGEQDEGRYLEAAFREADEYYMRLERSDEEMRCEDEFPF